jgi:predicted nucleic acid-binding protein
LGVSSFDSNLLVYAHNEAAFEHAKARSFLEKVLSDGSEQILILHQTLYELFAVLTSSVVFRRPLTTTEAWGICEFYLNHSAVQVAAYEPPVLSIVQNLVREKPRRGKRLFDLILAATLKYHGVSRLYTRNLKDFSDYAFLEATDPL